MRSPSCTSGFRLAAVRFRLLLVVAATAASLAALPGPAGAAAGKHGLERFGSCSRFVHYARRHASGELQTRGIPVDPPIMRTPTPSPMDNSGTVAPQEAAPVSGGA